VNWDEWLAENSKTLDESGTPFERFFVEKVLRHVPDLSPSVVEAQTHFKDLRGGSRRIDFTIQEGEHVRIALEVDGYDKTRSGTGMSREEFNKWSFRELSMSAAGWLPLRFANGLVVREPHNLIESIRLNLKAQRRIASAISGGEAAAQRAITERKAMAQAAKAARNGQRSAEEELRRLQAERREIDASFLDQPEKNRLLELEDELERRTQELTEQKEENKNMKTMWIAVGLVAAFGIVALFFMRGGDDNEATTAQVSASTATNDLEILSRCDEATPAEDLDESEVGDIVTSQGVVAGAVKIEDDTPRIYLNLGEDNPDQDLTVVIWGDDFGAWETSPEVKYDGRNIAVAGELQTYEGALQIVANSPNDVAICPQ
jgi:very-short-patch-repair endonuclease